MDSTSFDGITRLLAGATTRRTGLRAALGALAGLTGLTGLAAGAASKGSGERANGKARGTGRRKGKGKPGAEGPCGNGSRTDNACTKDKQCCTGYCKKGLKNRDGQGRCRCIKRGKTCKSSQTCCGTATCTNGVCVALVPTGGACVAGADTCADAAAICQSYDSDDPAGTYCLLPTGATCAANNDCWSQECAGGTCAAVVCTVCDSGCQFSDLESAIAAPPADGRIKLAPGTWTNTASSAQITQSMRIEACGGAPGVIVLPSQYYTFDPRGAITFTVKNLEFGYVNATAGMGGQGTDAQSMPTINIIGCTFHGGTDYYSLYPYDFFTLNVSGCTMESGTVFAGANSADASTLTITDTIFSGPSGYSSSAVIDTEGDLDVTLTRCTISGGQESGVRHTINDTASTATITIIDTLITGNVMTNSFGGGGIAIDAGNSGTINLVIQGASSITGNTAPADRGSGISVVSNGGTVTVTGASTTVSGNTPDPQCVRSTDNGGTFSPVANCAY